MTVKMTRRVPVRSYVKYVNGKRILIDRHQRDLNKKVSKKMNKPKVYFSFHYERDVVRANQVRHSWVTRGGEKAGFIDAAAFETVKRKGDQAVMDWIDRELRDTIVTAVLIGTETCERRWVLYEIKKSYMQGKGLLGIYIHNAKDFSSETCQKGNNPFEKLGLDYVPLYDWVNHDGRNNLPGWVQEAARNRR
jgi:hypothetical protein